VRARGAPKVGEGTVVHAVMSSTEEACGACGLVLQIWGSETWGLAVGRWEFGRGDDVTLSVVAGEEQQRKLRWD
jgi:hypothetical protein